MPFGSACPLPTYLADPEPLEAPPVDPLIAQIAREDELFLSAGNVSSSGTTCRGCALTSGRHSVHPVATSHAFLFPAAVSRSAPPARQRLEFSPCPMRNSAPHGWWRRRSPLAGRCCAGSRPMRPRQQRCTQRQSRRLAVALISSRNTPRRCCCRHIPATDTQSAVTPKVQTAARGAPHRIAGPGEQRRCHVETKRLLDSPNLFSNDLAVQCGLPGKWAAEKISCV
jgi:hypothetical protein